MKKIMTWVNEAVGYLCLKSFMFFLVFIPSSTTERLFH